MIRIRKIALVVIISAVMPLVGCAGSGSLSTSVHYGSYYDPYPYWGRGGDTTIIINNPDEPERPAKPPISKPPGDIGRPKPQKRRR